MASKPTAIRMEVASGTECPHTTLACFSPNAEYSNDSDKIFDPSANYVVCDHERAQRLARPRAKTTWDCHQRPQTPFSRTSLTPSPQQAAFLTSTDTRSRVIRSEAKSTRRKISLH
ncbi:hypothetical protein L798_00815 [Zootermopsis nevadensis]|uniref:Uncharacterized protein n=1 Tax=Zootermopsis nevadensis TaxID=136037 RepID=A0A067QKH0_ZOONE|nr:hypothetical protein L798_00815 [Zootermopsis nevadensis]